MICDYCFHLESYHSKSGCFRYDVGDDGTRWPCMCGAFVDAARKDDDTNG